MGDWVHRMESVDLESGTGVCRACGSVKLRMKYRTGREPLAMCEPGFRATQKASKERVKKRGN